MLHALIISAFLILFLREPLLQGQTPYLLRELGPASAAITAWGLMALVWLTTHLLIKLQVRRIDRGRLSAIAAADRIMLASRIAALAAHAVIILFLGWLEIIQHAIGDLILIDEFLAVLPFILALLGGWWTTYPVERRLREAVLLRDLDSGLAVRPLPTRAAHIISSLRHQAAIVFVPILIILAWGEAVEFAAARDLLPRWMPVEVLQLGGAIGAWTLMPLLLRRVWDTINLEPGPLRDDLIAMCREHRIRIRDVLLWRTHGTMINGAVMGLIGPARYVMLTDALLEMLPGEQVRAVMAHELGHIRRRHMPWLAGGAMCSMILAWIAVDLSVRWLIPYWFETTAAQTLILVSGLLAGLVIFGFVSRRFEWQADAFAAQHLSGWRGRRDQRDLVISPEAAHAMSSALGAVASLNHIPRHRFTWRHGSIASRQKRLLALVGRPAGRLKPDRDSALVKAAITAGLAMIAALVVVDKLF